MNRRQFLGVVGCSAVACSFPSIVKSQTLGLQGTAPSNRLTVGIIGLGVISRGHLTYVLNSPELQLVAICDVDRSVLKANRKFIDKYYADHGGSSAGLKEHTDFLAVVNDPSIDIIFNCTPDHWHALTLLHAARAGKSIYSEKPLCRTPAEGYAMVAEVERSGVVCQIGSQQRSSSEFQRAISLARNGDLGQIKRIKVVLPSGGGLQGIKTAAPQSVPSSLDYERWVGPSPLLPYVAERVHYNWRWCYEFAGGQLTDWINHHYDIAQLALGVSDEMPMAIRDIHAEFHTSPIYNTATQYSFTAVYSGKRQIEVSSQGQGGLTIEGDQATVFVTRGRSEFSRPSHRAIALPTQGFNLGPSDHRRNFIDCIRKGTRPRSPIDQAHKTAMVAHIANAAMRAGLGEVQWDDTKRTVSSPAAARFLHSTYRAPWCLPA